MEGISSSKAFKILKTSQYFRGLPDEILSKLLEISIPKYYKKDEFIFLEGEKAFGFYLIVEGTIKIFKESAKGKEVVIHIFGPGEIFAEIVLTGQDTYPASARALTDVELLYFPKKNLLALLRDKPELALQLLGLFAIRLRGLLHTIENLTFRDSRERLLHYIWELSDSGNKNEITLPLNKTQLALLLGITPETLSRLFQKLRDEGLLEIHRRKVTLLNPEVLKRELKVSNM